MIFIQKQLDQSLDDNQRKQMEIENLKSQIIEKDENNSQQLE